MFQPLLVRVREMRIGAGSHRSDGWRGVGVSETVCEKMPSLAYEGFGLKPQ